MKLILPGRIYLLDIILYINRLGILGTWEQGDIGVLLVLFTVTLDGGEGEGMRDDAGRDKFLIRS